MTPWGWPSTCWGRTRPVGPQSTLAPTQLPRSAVPGPGSASAAPSTVWLRPLLDALLSKRGPHEGCAGRRWPSPADPRHADRREFTCHHVLSPTRAGPFVTIAVTGATFDLGIQVARELAARGVQQRLVVRNPGAAPQLPGCQMSPSRHTRTRGDGQGPGAAWVPLLLLSAHEDRTGSRCTARQLRVLAWPGSSASSTPPSWVPAPSSAFPFARDHSATGVAVRGGGVGLTSCPSPCVPMSHPRSWGRTGRFALRPDTVA